MNKDIPFEPKISGAKFNFFNESEVRWKELLNKEFNIKSEQMENVNNPRMIYFHLKQIMQLKHFPAHKQLYKDYIERDGINDDFLKILDEHNDDEWENIISNSKILQSKDLPLMLVTLNSTLVDHFLKNPSIYPAVNTYQYLDYLALSGNKDMLIKHLQTTGLTPNENTLIYALISGNIEIVDYIRTHYKNIVFPDAKFVAYACKSGSLPLVKYLIEDLNMLPNQDFAEDCLIEAVKSNIMPLCTYLLKSKEFSPFLSTTTLSKIENLASFLNQNEIKDFIHQTQENLFGAFNMEHLSI